MPTEIKEELRRLARQPYTRVVAGAASWCPREVTNPKDPDHQPFTDLGAWEYVVDALSQEGITLTFVNMTDGRTGVVLKPRLPEGILYIKLQLGSGYVIGWSFHYSDYH